ncbi:Histidine protein like, partial [Actinidia chinensis var. chinensis]
LGCGHGLPGIFTGFEGAAVIHFQDFNAEWNVKDQNCSPVPDPSVGYDIILTAETVYSLSALPHLCELIKKCLNHPNGVVYMAAKKHYFGVGGGSRQFLSVVEKDGVMAASLIAEVANGSSNVPKEGRDRCCNCMLEQRWIILAMRLAEHQGKKYGIIEEALAFVGGRTWRRPICFT